MPKSYILLAHDEILLLEKEGRLILPDEKDIANIPLIYDFPLLTLHNVEYHVGKIDYPTNSNDTVKKLYHFRDAFNHLGEQAFQIIGRARQLLDWRIDHQFCGRCGTATEFFDQGRAKKCPACGLISYPRISPCIVVAITRGDQILLARSAYFRPHVFSILAGFVEAGETAEECVHREVMEEVGLKIKNIRYVDSQSWPFPNLLMLGFMAEYESGEIKIDETELLEARWFSREEVPSTLPIQFSLSYQLIKKFITS